MTKYADIASYHDGLAPQDRAICELLQAEIDRGLPGGESKVWHGHPVWFLDGNPIVGYDRLKDALRVMFWSGQSFTTPGLEATGTFKAAEVRYRDFGDVDVERFRAWLEESRTTQWNYRDIRGNRGLLELKG